MIGASKILTVSYGTFSCTLEGFDEPFNTMKAIAEYFRGLASEDRYFGAEPPQPDAEMLHKIAEREIKRRVDAKIQENGVILRQHDSLIGAQSESEPEVTPSPEPAQDLVADDTTAAAISAEAASAPVEGVAPQASPVAPEAPQAPVANEPESVAAKLQRIRAAVARARAEQPVTYEEDEQTDIVSQPSVAYTDAAASGEAADFDFDLDISGPLDAEDLDADAPLALSEEPSAPEAATPEAAADPADDTLIAGLAEALQPEQSEDLVDAVEDDTAEEAAHEAAENAPEAAEAEPEAVADLIEEAAAEAEQSPVAEIAAQPEAAAPASAQARVRARVIKVRRPTPAPVALKTEEPNAVAEAEAALEAAQSQDDVAQKEEEAQKDSEAAEVAQDAVGDDLAARLAAELGTTPPEKPAADAPRSSLSDEDEQDLMRELAMLSDDDETAEVEDSADLDADDADDSDDVDPDALDLDDAALAEALGLETPVENDSKAQTEADALEEDEEDDLALELDDEEDADVAPQKAAAAQMREPAPAAKAPEAEMSRLMQEADKQSAGKETRRRFSAIAHLKAAVAATVADRITKGQDTAGPLPEDERATEAYRADLSQAVQPRRPAASGGERVSRRPETALRPAPLVLVSEQRVDMDDDEQTAEPAAQAQPTTHVIRPRRVSSAQLAEAYDAETAAIASGDATSFEEFAETLGTQGLSDLLEAAAAYTSAVEGRPYFSPPQIMRKLTTMNATADVPREERMRVFGRLLRQGKITKVKRGQYAITQASRYYDEAKVASGQ